MTVCLGIDNGLHGAVVALTEHGLLDWHDTPIIATGSKGKGKNVFAAAEMATILQAYASEFTLTYEALYVIIETAQAMPGQGVSSTFKIGFGHGLWVGICAGLGLSYELVHPRTWQKAMLAGIPAGDTKARSMAKCQQLFPTIPLVKPRGRKLTMDGRADAALIAAWGLREMRGNGHQENQ